MNNREALYRAAISCRHEITHDQIILYVDGTKEGNALSQLADRLDQAALASQEHKLYTTANTHSFAEVVKDNFGALNVDRCPHCRKQES